MLFMIMSSKRKDSNHNTLFPTQLVLLKKGKLNNGDIATTPARGSFGFSYNNANVKRHPKPWDTT